MTHTMTKQLVLKIMNVIIYIYQATGIKNDDHILHHDTYTDQAIGIKNHECHNLSFTKQLVLKEREREREKNVLFNDALNTFYLRLYGIRHMVKDHSGIKNDDHILHHDTYTDQSIGIKNHECHNLAFTKQLVLKMIIFYTMTHTLTKQLVLKTILFYTMT